MVDFGVGMMVLLESHWNILEPIEDQHKRSFNGTTF